MKILITGIAGFLGSKFAEHLVKNPENRVIGIDNFSTGFRHNVPRRADVYGMNLLDEKNVYDVFDSFRPDVVYHFAAMAAQGLSPFVRKLNYESNVVATAVVVNACVNFKVKKLVFTSSMAVYGNNEAPYVETMVPSPIDPYGIAKYAAEMDIRVAGWQHGLNWTILRPHNVYGPGQNCWDPHRNVIGIWMRNAKNNEPMKIYGDGSQVREFTYIDDLMVPFERAMSEELYAQIINVGGVHKFTILNAAKAVQSVTGTNIPLIHLEPRVEVKNAVCDNKRAEDVLFFRHKTSLHNGLTEMWKWFKEEPNQPLNKKEYEIDNVYSYWKN